MSTNSESHELDNSRMDSYKPKGLLLNRVLLTNWLYYSHEIIQIGSVTVFQGDTGVGKSAICDAALFCLTCDTRGSYFNKAASGESGRTLDSYLRGKIQTIDGHTAEYCRSGTFSSHVALEFHDHYHDTHTTLLAVADVVNDQRKQVTFFNYQGDIPKNEFLIDGVPMNGKDAKKFLQSWNGCKGLRVNTANKNAYEENKVRLGSIGDFSQLLYRAASFDPKMNYDMFLKTYVCPVQTSMDLENLQARYYHLKQLRKDAKSAEERVIKLEELDSSKRQWKNARRNIYIHEYMERRLQEEKARTSIEKQREENEKLKTSLTEIHKKKNDLEKCLEEGRKRIDSLNRLLYENEAHKKIQRLEEEISRLQTDIHNRETNWRHIQALCKEICGTAFQAIKKLHKNSLVDVAEPKSDRLLLQAAEIQEVGEQINFNAPDAAQFQESLLQNFKDQIFDLHSNIAADIRMLEQNIKKYTQQILEKQQELEEAQKGIVVFPEQSAELKTRLENCFARTGEDAHPVIVAAETEIRDEAWRDAIEGYLANQKTNIIVDEEFFVRSCRILKEYRDELRCCGKPLRVRIVDIRKVRQKHIGQYVVPGTLAQEVHSDDERVDLYVKWQLGNVFECDSVKEMRTHDIAIRKNCMIYRGAAMGSLDPKLFKHPLMGSKAARLRVEVLKEDINELKNKMLPYQHNQQILTDVSQCLKQIPFIDAKLFADYARGAVEISEFKRMLKKTQAEKDQIDTSTLDSIRADLREQEKKNRQIDREKELCIRNIGGTEKGIEEGESKLAEKDRILQECIQAVKTAAEQHQDIIEEAEGRIESSRSRHEDFDALLSSFENTRSRRLSEESKLKNEVEAQKADYNNSYHCSLKMTEDSDDFLDELNRLKESGLPQKRRDLEDYEKETKDEYKQGILDKIRDDIETCARQRRQLNRFLGQKDFQGRKYSIQMNPHPVHKARYEAIMDRDCMEKDPEHWEEAMHEAHGDVLDQLYEEIFGSEDSLEDSSGQYREAVDYKTYIRMDLQETTIDSEGNRRITLMSRDSKEKSGGEGQLPFYLVILASAMMQYRIGVDTADNTMRVIFFDEAFSKMSVSLIPKSIEMAVSMGLQPVIFMPKLDPELLPSTEYLYYLAKTDTGKAPYILPFAELRDYMQETI